MTEATPAVPQEKFLEKLRTALSTDGDFPASAKIVAELKRITSDPNATASQIAEIILREPSLGARVLHVVNSTFYRRSKPIMTISQAVMQLGMKPLAELCSGMVLLQKFGTVSRRGHAFTKCLSRLVTSSLLTGALAQKVAGKSSAKDDYGYLVGSLSEMGPLLLAYYFPDIYENAAKRASEKKISVDQAIQELVGLTPMQLSLEVVNSLKLPEFYKAILVTAAGAKPPVLMLPSQQQILPIAAKVVETATLVSECLAEGAPKEKLDSILAGAVKSLGITSDQMGLLMAGLTRGFADHCSCVDLHLPALPSYLESYAPPEDSAAARKSGADNGSGEANSGPVASQSDSLTGYIEELKQAVASREPTASVITTVMETLAWGLGLERVILLLPGIGKRTLVGRMGLGAKLKLDCRSIEKPVQSSSNLSIIKAFLSGKTVFSIGTAGELLLDNGHSAIALPIGMGAKTIGVIYADKILTGNELSASAAQQLTPSEQATVSLLAELLDKSIPGAA